MRTFKKSEIKETRAVDITTLTNAQYKELEKAENGFNIKGISTGIYGVSGAIATGNKTGTWYKITGKCNALIFMV